MKIAKGPAVCVAYWEGNVFWLTDPCALDMQACSFARHGLTMETKLPLRTG